MSVDQSTIVQVGIDIGLDLLKWWEQRHRDGQAPPTAAEVTARVKAKIAAGNREGDDFESEQNG